MMFTGNEHFKPHEFDSPDEPGSGGRMQPKFIAMLTETRKRAGRAMRINSGYRTQARNKKVGGKSDSAHLGGWAADVEAESWENFKAIVTAGLLAGFRRIGCMTGAVHFDNDPSKNPALWLYTSRNVEQRRRVEFVEHLLYLLEMQNKNL
jgi:zinc D-Ala-D-Ala carboxypeptidase